jgi:hypothetical protein
MMAGANEKFSSALELLPGIPRVRQYQTVKAAAVLMKPIKNISYRARSV